MDQKQLNELSLEMRLVDAEGNEVAKCDMPYANLADFRKANGAPASVLLENLLGNLVNLAMYGPGGQGAGQNLPPRKPGGLDFNK
jgi:hypothetical protein